MENDKGIKSFILRTLSYWKAFILSVVIFVGLAFLYLKYTTPQYLVSSIIMLKDQKNMAESKAVTTFANDNGLSALLKPSENVLNELDVLTSRKLAGEVIKELKLNIKIGEKDGPKFVELYDRAPFDASLASFKTDSIKERNFEIEFLPGNKVRVSSEEEQMEKTVGLNETVQTSQYDLTLQPTIQKLPLGRKFLINVVSENTAISNLLSSYTVELSDKQATTVNLQLYYPHPKRGEQILQSLMERYLVDNRDEKIRIADSLLVFIDDRLALVASELNDVEAQLESFRSSNRITDLSEQSRLLVGNANEYYNRLKEQEAQLKVMGELETYVKNPQNQRIPSSTVIQNSSFASSLNQYNALIQDYEKKKLSYTDSNPVLQNLKSQIASERTNLLQNISSYRKELQLTSSELGRQNSGYNSQISKVPARERAFVNFSRQQELKQQLYVYLLQKREEATIAKSANAQSAKIVDAAKSTNGPVKPVPSIIYIMAGLLGLIVPFGFINGRELIRTKLNSESDIERYTDIEIIGKIAHNASPQTLAIGRGMPNTVLSEGFRSLRTNLYYALQSKASKTLMVTSSVNGEGKTFMSLNLGNALSLTGKKVVFVELDLRKPKLAQMMGITESTAGFSDVVLGRQQLDDVIIQGQPHSNCYLLSAGTRVDNPSELLLENKVTDIFSELREKFDYIIVDSPPVGLVSDAMIIQQYVEMTVYVCRHNYTKKEQIEFINELKRKNKLGDMYLVVNDVDMRYSGYQTYGYGYGYDHEESPNKSIWKRTFKK
ncbi:polysaccharide biosynthesis tyrosine autokinase [Olivibacter sp. CPCC 100613]|uniref:GumC family protein n=1 Tax=Olivibacter sp. CPCC 100613 TaxID=3079931 RepID=UPI002FF704A9